MSLKTIAIVLAAPASALQQPTESVLIDGTSYEIPAPVACELLRLHIEMKQAAPQQPVDESSEFVAWWRPHAKADDLDPDYLPGTQRIHAWAAWQARAALSAPQQPEAPHHIAGVSKMVDERETIFAWATFDGEGGYDFRLYEGNESYRDDYIKRKGPQFVGWVTALTALSAPPAVVEPLFWYRPVCNGEMYEGPVHNNSVGGKMLRDEKPGEWLPLYPAPRAVVEPPELSPDFTDTARSALLWVLWHHQGGSSPVGQPIRFALGMGAHDRLSEHQLAEAKRWERLHPVNPSVFPRGPEPLTDEEIDLIAADGMRNAAGGIYQTRVYEFARAIEAAHGIKKGDSNG